MEVRLEVFTVADKLGLRSTEEREQILSKLYEIQHPSGPSVSDILNDPYFKGPDSQNKSLYQPRSHRDEGQVERSSQDTISHSLHVWHNLSGMFTYVIYSTVTLY